MDPVDIFVCYSRKDSRWVDAESPHNLIPWLADALRNMKGRVWYDTELRKTAGVEYRRKIAEKIGQAQVAILLLSQNLLNSDFIRDYELPLIKDKVSADRMSIIPILVGPISWEGEDDFKWLAERQIIPGKPTPLVDYAGDIKKWEYVKINRGQQNLTAQFEILEACKRRITEIQKGSETIPDQAGIIKSNRSDKINDQDKPALNLHRYYKVAIAIIAIVLTVLGLRKFLFVSSVTIADKDGITSAALSIVEPKSGASLPSVITVRGTASRHDRVWLIVHPTATSDYWVQAGVERGSRGELPNRKNILKREWC